MVSVYISTPHSLKRLVSRRYDKGAFVVTFDRGRNQWNEISSDPKIAKDILRKNARASRRGGGGKRSSIFNAPKGLSFSAY